MAEQDALNHMSVVREYKEGANRRRRSTTRPCHAQGRHPQAIIPSHQGQQEGGEEWHLSPNYPSLTPESHNSGKSSTPTSSCQERGCPRHAAAPRRRHRPADARGKDMRRPFPGIDDVYTCGRVCTCPGLASARYGRPRRGPHRRSRDRPDQAGDLFDSVHLHLAGVKVDVMHTLEYVCQEAHLAHPVRSKIPMGQPSTVKEKLLSSRHTWPAGEFLFFL